jgi:hypothetical protein
LGTHLAKLKERRLSRKSRIEVNDRMGANKPSGASVSCIRSPPQRSF